MDTRRELDFISKAQVWFSNVRHYFIGGSTSFENRDRISTCSLDKSDAGKMRKWQRSRYVEEIGLAAMLAAKRSAGVAPEVNLRERTMLLVRLCQVRIRQNPLWLWNPEETSPEVQNRGIIGPTKRTHVLQKF